MSDTLTAALPEAAPIPGKITGPVMPGKSEIFEYQILVSVAVEYDDPDYDPDDPDSPPPAPIGLTYDELEEQVREHVEGEAWLAWDLTDVEYHGSRTVITKTGFSAEVVNVGIC